VMPLYLKMGWKGGRGRWATGSTEYSM